MPRIPRRSSGSGTTARGAAKSPFPQKAPWLSPPMLSLSTPRAPSTLLFAEIAAEASNPKMVSKVFEPAVAILTDTAFTIQPVKNTNDPVISAALTMGFPYVTENGGRQLRSAGNSQEVYWQPGTLPAASRGFLGVPGAPHRCCRDYGHRVRLDLRHCSPKGVDPQSTCSRRIRDLFSLTQAGESAAPRVVATRSAAPLARPSWWWGTGRRNSGGGDGYPQ